MTVIMIVAAMVLAGGGACGVSDGGGEDGAGDACGEWWAATGPPSDAWVGAVTACARAPACPHTNDCGDPRWRVLADWALDEIARCFAGPCEERAACVAAAMPPEACWRI